MGKGQEDNEGQKGKKKKENNKNDDSLSLCDLFMYIYLSIYFI